MSKPKPEAIRARQQRERNMMLGLELVRCPQFREAIGLKPGERVSSCLLAELCGVSDETILRVEKQAVRKLRAAVAERGLADDFDLALFETD